MMSAAPLEMKTSDSGEVPADGLVRAAPIREPRSTYRCAPPIR